MHLVLHPTDDIRLIHARRTDGGSGLTGAEHCVDALIQGIEEQKTLITTEKNSNIYLGHAEKYQKLKNKNRKKNNSIDISSNKLG